VAHPSSPETFLGGLPFAVFACPRQAAKGWALLPSLCPFFTRTLYWKGQPIEARGIKLFTFARIELHGTWGQTGRFLIFFWHV
jgi:hypothetical protein